MSNSPTIIKIDPEFRSLIPELTKEELAGLEASLLADGCRDQVICWNDILVDGHNRKEICERHGIKFETRRLNFLSRDAAKAWIIKNQFARRNLSDAQRAELALKLEPLFHKVARENLKTSSGGPKPRPRQNSAEAGFSGSKRTRDEVAKVAGVSHETIRQVKKLQQNAAPEIMDMARAGDISIRAATAVSHEPVEVQKEIASNGAEAVKQHARQKSATELPPSSESDKPKPRGKGLELAYRAINCLKEIPIKDGLRAEALDLVARWIEHNREVNV